MSRQTIVAFLLLVVSAAGLSAQVPEPWQFKLVKPETGWLLKDHDLLWTENNGAEWKDIAPALAPEQTIAAVFFLDARRGWCLLHDFHPGPDEPTALEIAATDDAGTSWSRASLAASDTVLRQRYGWGGEIVFTDSRNGWVKFKLMSGAAYSFSALFRTSDGGRTWLRLPDPPIDGHFGMLADGFGWLAGGVLSNAVYLTRDGGRSWVPSEVRVASQGTAAPQIYFGRPGFQDPQHGVLPVSVGLDEQMSLLVYSTTDGGATWQVLNAENHIPVCCFLHTSAVGSRVLRASPVQGGGTQLGDGAISFPLRMPEGVGPQSEVERLDFIDAYNGWFAIRGEVCPDRKAPCLVTRALLATVNGGDTLSPIYIDHSTRVRKSRSERGEGPST